jgi:hypothetical protein
MPKVPEALNKIVDKVLTHQPENKTQRIIMEEGWGWPRISKKWHYFINKRSLCGRFAFFGELEAGNNESPDNCADCKKRLTKRLNK